MMTPISMAASLLVSAVVGAGATYTAMRVDVQVTCPVASDLGSGAPPLASGPNVPMTGHRNF